MSVTDWELRCWLHCKSATVFFLPLSPSPPPPLGFVFQWRKVGNIFHSNAKRDESDAILHQIQRQHRRHRQHRRPAVFHYSPVENSLSKSHFIIRRCLSNLRHLSTGMMTTKKKIRKKKKKFNKFRTGQEKKIRFIDVTSILIQEAKNQSTRWNSVRLVRLKSKRNEVNRCFLKVLDSNRSLHFD